MSCFPGMCFGRSNGVKKDDIIFNNNKFNKERSCHNSFGQIQTILKTWYSKTFSEEGGGWWLDEAYYELPIDVNNLRVANSQTSYLEQIKIRFTKSSQSPESDQSEFHSILGCELLSQTPEIDDG